MSLSLLPDFLIQYELYCYLDFKESINLRMTDKFFNDSYSYRHDPRLDYQYGIRQSSQTGNLDAIYNILKLPYADPTFYNNYALRTSILRNHSKVLSLLLEDDRIDLAMLSFSPIIAAVRNRHLDTLKVLLKDGRCDPGLVAIQLASIRNYVEIVEALLQDPRVNPNTGAFPRAAYFGHTELVEIFIHNPRLDPASEHNRAIRNAARMGNSNIVKVLLALQTRGVDPGEIFNGKNALDEAVYQGHTKVVKLLIDDTRVNPASQHNLAIRIAARKGNSAMVKCLLALKSPGVDPGEIINGKNALDEALSFYSISHFETAKAISPNAVPSIETLSMLVKRGYLVYVKLLLNDRRVILTNEQVKTLTIMIKRRRFFPQFQQNSEDTRWMFWGARKDKKEVIMLLSIYNEQ
jgi:ankyrin repeat protein